MGRQTETSPAGTSPFSLRLYGSHYLWQCLERWAANIQGRWEGHHPRGPHHSQELLRREGVGTSYLFCSCLGRTSEQMRDSGNSPRLPDDEIFLMLEELCSCQERRVCGWGGPPGAHQVSRQRTASRRSRGEAFLPRDPPLRCHGCKLPFQTTDKSTQKLQSHPVALMYS